MFQLVDILSVVKHKNAIEIWTAGKGYFLFGETERERDEWLTILIKAVDERWR